MKIKKSVNFGNTGLDCQQDAEEQADGIKAMK